jgi:hypothetical protein
MITNIDFTVLQKLFLAGRSECSGQIKGWEIGFLILKEIRIYLKNSTSGILCRVVC